MDRQENGSITIRAVPSSYIVLTGIMFLLAGLVGYVAWLNPSVSAFVVALLPLAFAAGIAFWLSRIQLSVSDEELEYRDGVKAAQRVRLNQIGSAEHTWIAGEINGRRVFGPHLVVYDPAGKPLLLVHSKVFGLKDLQRVLDRLERAVGAV